MVTRNEWQKDLDEVEKAVRSAREKEIREEEERAKNEKEKFEAALLGGEEYEEMEESLEFD